LDAETGGVVIAASLVPFGTFYADVKWMRDVRERA